MGYSNPPIPWSTFEGRLTGRQNDGHPGERPGAEEAPVSHKAPAYEPPRHSGGNNFAFVDGHVRWLGFHGGPYVDGGPWVVQDMSMYSRTGSWEKKPLP